MEVIAGEHLFETQVSENECRFTLDYRTVYWNSRLQHEHRRLIDVFQVGDVVCDVFAGIGPFAVPAAKKGSLVLANDLNPASFMYLNENVKRNMKKPGQTSKSSNKTSGTAREIKMEGKVQTFNLDGREMIRRAQELSVTYFEGRPVDHVVMNLPATAIEFLDAFRHVEFNGNVLPQVHCYCFTREAEQPEVELKQVCSCFRVCFMICWMCSGWKKHWDAQWMEHSICITCVVWHQTRTCTACRFDYLEAVIKAVRKCVTTSLRRCRQRSLNWILMRDIEKWRKINRKTLLNHLSLNTTDHKGLIE
jgi:hypothetical protein